MRRKCSGCGYNGHNSRTCIAPKVFLDNGSSGGGVRLFGVQLHTSFSAESLPYAAASSTSPSSSSSSLVSTEEVTEKAANGYVSDALLRRTPEKRKGVPWTEEEHRLFLAGLEKLGKGDWRGISRNFVITRTPTQVASHAQKYFLRHNRLSKSKRRSSLLDEVPNCERTSDQSSDPNHMLKEHPISWQLDSIPRTALSITSHAAAEISATVLNTDEEKYFLSALARSCFDQIQRPHAQFPQINLELSISSPRQKEQNKPWNSTSNA